MARRRLLKAMHAAGTAWFLLAASYLLVLNLRHAGINWWVIFSLSGQSAALLFLMLSAYLFAVFRSSNRELNSNIEHPLSNSTQYMTLYSLIPFLGSFTGLVCVYDAENFQQVMFSLTMGALAATFGMWIIFDPVISLIEMLTPASRAHRAKRRSEASQTLIVQEKYRQELLDKLEAEECENQKNWRSMLSGHAQALCELVTAAKAGNAELIQKKGIQIGLIAWQQGGLECMQELEEMAIENIGSKSSSEKSKVKAFISVWWDGIGSWRHLNS